MNSTPISGQPTLLLGTIVTPTPTPTMVSTEPETSSSPPPSTQLDDEITAAPQELSADVVEITDKIIIESSLVNNNAKNLTSTVTDKSETENSPPNKGASPPPSLKKVRVNLFFISWGIVLHLRRGGGGGIP